MERFLKKFLAKTIIICMFLIILSPTVSLGVSIIEDISIEDGMKICFNIFVLLILLIRCIIIKVKNNTGELEKKIKSSIIHIILFFIIIIYTSNSEILNIIQWVKGFSYIIILFIIFKYYYINPTSIVKLLKTFILVALACSLIFDNIVAIKIYELDLVKFLVFLPSNLLNALLMLILYQDTIIVKKAIKLSGKTYEELDKNKKYIFYVVCILIVIIYLIQTLYINYKVNKTEELRDIYESYIEYMDNDNFNDSLNDYFVENDYEYNDYFDNIINSDFQQFEQITGDINGDERVSMTDLSLLKGHIVKTKVLEGSQYIAADINGDGNVSMTDLSKIKSIIVGM